MNNDIQSKQFQQFYKALKKGSLTGKDRTLEEVLLGNIRFEQHKEADEAGRIVERIKVAKAKTREEKETFARHNTSNISNVVEMIQKYMEQQLKANVNKLYRMKEEADKILDAELNKITIQYGTKINKNIPTNLKADIVKAANASKKSVKDVVGKMTVGKTGKTYNEAEEYSKFLREHLGDADVIFSTKDEIKKMLLELHDNSQIDLGDEFEAEISSVKKEKVSHEKIRQIVDEKMKSYKGKRKGRGDYKHKLRTETKLSENRRVEADYNNNISSAKERAFEKYHGNILEAAHTYALTEDSAFAAAKSQIIQSVADGKSKAPTDIKFEDYSEKIEKTKQNINELELEMAKAVDIIVEKQLDHTNGVFANVGAEFRNLAEKIKTGSVTDKDKKKIQKEISLIDKNRKDDIKKLDNTYRAEQRNIAGIGRKTKQTMDAEKLALENKKKPYDDLRSRYADPSVLGLEDSELFTKQGKVKTALGRKLFGASDSEMDQKDERIAKKENVEQIRKDAELYKKLQEKPFTEEDQNELDKVNLSLSLLEQIEKTIKEGDYDAIKAYNEQSKAIIELLTHYEKINTDIDEKKTELSEVTDKQNEANTLVNATKAPEQIAKQEEKVSNIMATKNEAEGNVLGLGEHIGQMMRHFGSYMLRLRLVQRGIQDIVNTMREFQKIDDEAFQLGMVSEMNVGSIRNYRNEVLGLAADYRTTAEEIINTQSEIIKTGRTFEQARQQVSASLTLSKATFETLSDAGSIINKMMLGLEIGGEKSFEIMNKIYNVIQATPQSVAGLDAAFRQSGSAFSGLLDEISYSGEQLDEYKNQLADAQMSLLGLISLQGKTPMMAGTAVKTLVDKMRGPTDKARTTINRELATNKAVDENGNQITMKTLQTLAETDFNKAINTLSSLYTSGKLSYQSIQDLFGPRNAATLSKLMYQVNGSIEQQNELLLNQRDVIKDSEKIMGSWSQEMEELKNSFRALKGVANDFGDVLKPFVNATGETLQSIAKTANENLLAKSAIQSTAGVGAATGFMKNFLMSMYAAQQASSGNVGMTMTLDDNQRQMAQLGMMAMGSGGIVKQWADLKESMKASYGHMKDLFNITEGGIKGIGKTILSSIFNPVTLGIAGVIAVITLLTYAYKQHQELLSKIDQSMINISKSANEAFASMEGLNISLLSIGEALSSIEPSAFGSAKGLSLLEESTKSLLDSAIQYTIKLDGLNNTLFKQNKIKEAEQTLNDRTSTTEAKEKAQAKIDFLKENNIDKLSMEELNKRINKTSEENDVNKMREKFINEIFIKNEKEYGKNSGYMSEENSRLMHTIETATDEDIRKIYIEKKIKELSDSNIASNKNPYQGKENQDYLLEAKKEVQRQSQLEEIEADIAKEFIQYRENYYTSLNESLNKDLSNIKDISNHIIDIIQGNEKDILLKNNKNLSNTTILEMTKYDKKMKDAINKYIKGNIFDRLEYQDANSIINQYVLLDDMRQKNENIIKNRNQMKSVGKNQKGETVKIYKTGSIFDTMSNVSLELSKQDLTFDSKELNNIFMSNEKDAREQISKIQNIRIRKIIESNYEKYKEQSKSFIAVNNMNLKTDSIEKIKTDLMKLYGDGSGGNAVAEKLLELAEMDIDKYNDLMKILLKDSSGKFRDAIDSMASHLGYNIETMRFDKYAMPMMEASIRFQEAVDAIVKKGIDRIAILNSKLKAVQNKKEFQGEYANIDLESQVASLQYQTSIEQQRQVYLESISKNVTDTDRRKLITVNDIHKIAQKAIDNLTSEEKVLLTNEKREHPTSTISDTKFDGVYNKLITTTEGKTLLDKTDKQILNKNRLESSKVYTKAKGATSADGLSTKEKEAYTLLESSKYDLLKSLGLTKNDLKKLEIELNTNYIEAKKMAIVGMAKFAKDTSLSGISSFVESMIDINGKIDEKYNIFISQIGEASYDKFSDYNDVEKNIKAKQDRVDVISKFSANEFENEATQGELKTLNKQIEEMKQVQAVRNQIMLLELENMNKINQFLINIKKELYDFNREIGSGKQFASDAELYDAIANKYSAEKTKREVMQNIQEKYTGSKIEFNKKTKKYELKDQDNNTIENDTVSQDMAKLTKIDQTLQNAITDIESYKSYFKEQTFDEISLQTKSREMTQFVGDTSNAGQYRRRKAQRELDISKLNIFYELFEEINKSISSLPEVQLTILENQKKSIQNTRSIWEKEEDSVTKTVEIRKLIAEENAKNIEIAKYELDIKKQIVEKQKNIYELQKQRYDILGSTGFMSPTENYSNTIKNLAESFRLSALEIGLEDEQRKLAVENIDALKNLTIELKNNTKALADLNPDINKEQENNAKAVKGSSTINNSNISKKHTVNNENRKNKSPETTHTVNNQNIKNKSPETTKKDDEKLESDIELKNSALLYELSILKKREEIEKYITGLYKARIDYIADMEKKYSAIPNSVIALATGDKSKIKYDKPDFSHSLFTAIGAGIELKKLKNKDYDYAPNEEFDKLLSDDKAWFDFINKADKKYQDKYIKDGRSEKDEIAVRKDVLKMKQTDDFNKLMAQAAVQTVVGVFDVINEASTNKLKLELAGLQHEQRILEMRKSGYRTEYAKYNMDKHIQANKRKQVEKEAKIAEKEKDAQNGALFGAIGQGLLSSKEPHAMAAGAALMILQKPLGKLFDDGSAKIEKERKLAEFNTEESFKEYDMFWDRFFKVIEKMTSYAEQKIESMTSDYNKSRNLTRRNKTRKDLEDEAKIIKDSVNDFEGMASATKTVKAKTWYGKTKKSKVTTDWNFAMDNLDKDQILSYANMTDEQLREAMISEAKKDNPDKYVKDSKGRWYFKNDKGEWSVTDEALYDFRKSLQDAAEAIDYLDRMISDTNLSNKEFYGDLEGFSVEKESEIKNQFNEQIAAALAAGDTATAELLKSTRDRETQKFKTAGVTEIYTSTFSQIMYEAAEKVGKDTGNFSDAFATGIGAMVGTTFRNTIDEIMKRGIKNNSYLDEWSTKFYEGMKNFNGNLANFINNDGVLDFNALSETVGAGSITDKLLANKSDWDKMNNLNIYRTSSNLASQLRSAGLDEVSIGKFLESAGLKDILKDAVNEIADIFNPVGLSSAKLKMKRESFDSDNGRRAEEIRRKQLLGTASDGELKELDAIENGYLKLSIEENVYNGFKSGIESAIQETTYTNIFSKFGGMIGDAISKTALKNLNLDKSAQKVADLLTAGNYAEAGKEIRNTSLTALAVAKQNEESAKKLREQGLDWTEIYGSKLIPNIYQDVTNELSSQNSFKNISAKYKKSEIDFSNTMATDKYNNSEYYNELMNRKARGEFISENEAIWIEQYESSLTNITNKQNLLNSLQSSFNSMLSNKTGLDYLKQVSQSIGQTIDEMIMQKIKVDFTMESLIEKIIGGKNANKEIAELSKVYKSAKSTQELIKNQMLSNGASYSLIEQMFGEDVASTIADIYSEMQNYSNTLGRISYQEEHYKKEIISVNGVLFQYDEYYRELNLKKANGISLTESEIAWMNRYTDTMKKFETNKKIVTEFYSAVGQAFNSEELLKSFSSFADSFNNILKEKIVDGYLSNELSNDMANMISIAQNALSTGTVSDLYSAQKQMMAFSAKVQTVKNQTQGLIDMFDSSKIIDFTDKTKDITYNASSSKETVYNITQNLSVAAGAVIGDGVSLDKLAKTLAPYLSKELKKY